MPAVAPAITAPDSDFTASREIRNLGNLARSWSSCRVLNLSHIHLLCADNADYAAKPFFEHSALNRAIILKHTLRLDERDLFPNGRRTVTKIILPYDPRDLKLGGSAFFVRQQRYDQMMRTYLGIDDLKCADAQVLRCLDALPSLDPFLMREHLAKAGFQPSGIYFQISPADLKGMMAFTTTAIENLVDVAFGGGGTARASKLGTRLLSDKLSETLKPLQQTLRMTDAEFHEGITCWRGFLYYKWCHVELQDSLREVLSGLGGYRLSGSHDDSLRAYLKKARPRVARAIVDLINDAQKTLDTYDEVYVAMSERRDPEPFRRFLLFGSTQFLELGEKIGVLNHIVSFWKFRMARLTKKGAKPMQDIEFADILLDFEAGLFNAIKRDPLRPYVPRRDPPVVA